MASLVLQCRKGTGRRDLFVPFSRFCMLFCRTDREASPKFTRREMVAALWRESFALWPFWESSLPHFLKYPVLLSPLFVSIALYAAPDLAQKYVAAVLITAGCFHGVACLWQFFIVYPELLADAEVLQLTKAQVFRLNEGRTLGLSTSPDLAAMLCIAGLFCSISFFQNTPQYRPVLLLSLILTFCGVTLTRSTGGLLSILVGLGVVFIAHRKNKKVLNLFLCLLVMFGGLSLFLSFRGFDALATSSHERFLNWTGAFDIIKHNFWQGVGPGQFPAAYELYRPMGSNITRYAHSFPLQLTAELGIWAWFGSLRLWLSF